MWATAGILEAPQAGDILADTGPLVAGVNTFTLLIWSEQAVNFKVHQRNALNTADIQTQVLAPSIGLLQVNLPLTLSLNQRITITLETNMTLSAQASILA